jgi:hypothetical protein
MSSRPSSSNCFVVAWLELTLDRHVAQGVLAAVIDKAYGDGRAQTWEV